MSDYQGEVLSCSRRRLAYRFLRAFMAEVRKILARRAPDYYRRFPDARRPCHSCAFNPSTDGMQGWDSTAFQLQKALSEGRPFFCHQGIPWTKPIGEWSQAELARFFRTRQLCAGYVAIFDDPDAKTAVERAAVATRSTT